MRRNGVRSAFFRGLTYARKFCAAPPRIASSYQPDGRSALSDDRGGEALDRCRQTAGIEFLLPTSPITSNLLYSFTNSGRRRTQCHGLSVVFGPYKNAPIITIKLSHIA